MPHASFTRIAHGAALFALLVLPMLLGGCGFNPPQGFAESTRGGGDRALSPEGVMYTERTLPNDPKADLEFWSKALRNRMEQAGYRIVGVTADTAVGVHGKPGRLLRLAAPLGERDYLYWIAISVEGRRIRVIEAAGEAAAFSAREAEILAAIAAD